MKKFLIFFLILVGLSLPEICQGAMKVRVYLDQPEQIDLLLQYDIVFVKKGVYVDIFTHQEQLEKIKEMGLRTEILIPDLADYYKNLGGGILLIDFGPYYTYDEMVAAIDEIHADHPGITNKVDIGTSIQGRTIWAMKVSDNPLIEEGEPQTLFTSVHHAREPIGCSILIDFLNTLTDNYGVDPMITFIVENREIWVVPVVNPDGYVINEIVPDGMWRKNRRDNGGGSFGVDINRNYGFQWGYDDYGSSPYPDDDDYRGTGPFSEPETHAIRDLVTGHEFVIALNYHSYGNLLLFSWGYDDFYTPEDAIFRNLAKDFTPINGYTSGTSWEVSYNTNGTANDWMYGDITKPRIFAFTPEVGEDFWQPDTNTIVEQINENRFMNICAALASGPHPFGCDCRTIPEPITTNPVHTSIYFDPLNPWVQEGLVIDSLRVVAGVDLFNLHFFSDALQCGNIPCEPGDAKKIHEDLIEFVPEEIAFVPAGETLTIEVKVSVPIGQHTCVYAGEIHAIAETFDPSCPKVYDDIRLSVNVLQVVDMDVDDNHGNVSDNVLTLRGAKGDQVTGTFTVVNPNSEVKNVDLPDGPGNIRIDPLDLDVTNLTKIGDPGEIIPAGSISFSPGTSLASGEAQDITVTINIPNGIPINATYTGEVTVTYKDCRGYLAPRILATISDNFTLQVEVLPTQGPLDILAASFDEDFCPSDPWTQMGQVEVAFDITAIGDHRNIRFSSGGLEHESLDKKLDDFNFFPGEIAFLATGETREVRVITKIPIGQHEGTYSGFIQAVSENGGEDSVGVTIDICTVHDMDIKDDYANLSDNIMEIQAISRANSPGSEWVLRAFDIGLPNALVNNHDEYDGPGNTPIDCISWEFAEWSPLWHEDDHDTTFTPTSHSQEKGVSPEKSVTGGPESGRGCSSVSWSLP
jgi:hypothetical protein